MLVTQISLQKRKGYFNVFVDGKYSFSLNEEDLVKEKLRAGIELSEERLNELKFKGKYSLYLNRMFNFLSFRPRSKREVEQRIDRFLYKEKEIQPENKQKLKQEVIRKLESMGLVNDEEFAKWFIEQRQKGRKPSGAGKVRMELYKKGVDKEAVENAISDYKEDEGVAMLALEKKYKVVNKDNLKEVRLSAFNFLARRGFDFEVIKSVIDTFIKHRYNKSGLNND